VSELPSGWATARVGELIELNPKNVAAPDSPSAFMPMAMLGTSYLDRPGFEQRTWAEISKTYVHFAEGDVLLAKITPCFENGKAGIAADLPGLIGAGSSEYFVCRTQASSLLPRLLLAYFKTDAFLQGGAQQMTGSVGHKRVPKDYLLGTEIPVPPIAEQQRITDKLDKLLARVDACRDRLDRLPSLIDRLRQSALAGAIQGSLTADWRAANGSAVAGIEAEADELAVRSVPGWTYERADAACSKVQSGGTPKEGFIAAGGAPFLKVYNLVGQQVDFAYRPQFIADNIHRGSMRKSITLPGDVLMNIVGPPLGKVAVVPADFPQWNINQAITLFRAGPKVLSEWLYFVLCEGSAVRQVMPDTRGSVGQVNISLSQCRAFVLPVPPIDEQREAVRRLQKLFVFAQQLSDRLRNAEAAVNRLTPAVLAKAFRGELVAQDPADEPSGVMLQRLRTGVAPEASAKRRRRPATA